MQPEQPITQQPIVAPQVGAAEPATSTEPRNILAAMLLTTFLGVFGLHQVYLGKKTQGWVRFGFAIAALLTMVIFIGSLILLPLLIWAVVDFFLVYLKRVDADGRELTGTNRDKVATKAIFITAIVYTVTMSALIAVMITIVGYAGIQGFRNLPSGGSYDGSSLNQSF